MNDACLPVAEDPWQALRRHTAARIALGRAGASLPTAEVLRFGLDHARAQDVVHAALAVPALAAALAALQLPQVLVHSRAPDRATYLLRPDLGRCLNPSCSPPLAAARAVEGHCDVAAGLADGLSATAVPRYAVPLLAALSARLPQDWRLAPIVIACQARVALRDEIGAALRARLVLVLIGERPGLSAPDSPGAPLA
jgi:ethanolamine ammonia-lyase small subunit